MIDLEKRKAYQKQWQKDNRDKMNARVRKYKQNNPDKVKETQKKQSVRKRELGLYKTEEYKKHIKPCVTFDLTSQEDIKKCFHYTNLQPLDAKTNMSKGRKLWL